MRTPGKKPRGDSKLDRLAPAQKEQLAEWLTIEGITYEAAAARVFAAFSVATNTKALSHFYFNFAVPWQYAGAKGGADAFAQLVEGKFDEATLKRAKQLAFSALTDRNPDVKTAKALLKIVGDSAKVDLAKERLSLDARKVALLEAKAALTDQAKAVTDDAALTDEEKLQRYKQIFGA